MEYNTLVVNAFGGAGAGKTTACFHIASELKKRGFVTEYVPEYAKELVWDKNFEMLDGSEEHQQALLTEQAKRLDRLIGQVEIVVTDSPLLLNGIYLAECPEKAEYCEKLLEKFKTYNNFNVVVQRDAEKYEQEGRIHTLEQSVEVDHRVEQLLAENELYYGTYTHSALDKIVDNIIKNYKKPEIRIIGNIPYKELGTVSDLHFFNDIDNTKAELLAAKLEAAGIKYSGVVKDRTTITVRKKDVTVTKELKQEVKRETEQKQAQQR